MSGSWTRKLEMKRGFQQVRNFKVTLLNRKKVRCVQELTSPNLIQHRTLQLRALLSLVKPWINRKSVSITYCSLNLFPKLPFFLNSGSIQSKQPRRCPGLTLFHPFPSRMDEEIRGACLWALQALFFCLIGVLLVTINLFLSVLQAALICCHPRVRSTHPLPPRQTTSSDSKRLFFLYLPLYC